MNMRAEPTHANSRVRKRIGLGARAGAAEARVSFQKCLLEELQPSSHPLRIQAGRLARRFGLTPATATVVAALVFPEVAR